MGLGLSGVGFVFTGLPMTGQGKEEVNSLLLLKV